MLQVEGAIAPCARIPSNFGFQVLHIRSFTVGLQDLQAAISQLDILSFIPSQNQLVKTSFMFGWTSSLEHSSATV